MARPKNDPLDKLCKALEIGTPLQVALRYSGIPAPEYRHWEDMHLSYFYMIMTEKMKGEDGIELEEPNPDIYARMISSKQYKAECKKMLFTESDKYFSIASMKKVHAAYRTFYIRNSSVMTNDNFRAMHDAIIAGDPKLRSLRALYTTVYKQYADFSRETSPRKGGEKK